MGYGPLGVGVNTNTNTVYVANYGSNTVSVITQPAAATPPTTTASLSGKAGANGWYVGPVTVTLTATPSQGGSPVASTTYSIDAASPQTYSNPFTISTDGKHVLTFNSTDTAGNAEKAQTLAINIDQTAPSVACSVSPTSLWPPNHKLVNVTATVNVSDATSGAAGFTLVSITSNGGSASDIQGWTPGTPSTNGQLTANKDTVYTLVYRGTDQAGNASSCTTTVSVPPRSRQEQRQRCGALIQRQRRASRLKRAWKCQERFSIVESSRQRQPVGLSGTRPVSERIALPSSRPIGERQAELTNDRRFDAPLARYSPHDNCAG